MALWTFVSKMTQLPTLETDNLVQIPEFSAEIRLPVAPELRLESTGLLILELLNQSVSFYQNVNHLLSD